MAAVGPVARAAAIGSTGTAAVVDRPEPLAIIGSAQHTGSQSASGSTAGAGH